MTSIHPFTRLADGISPTRRRKCDSFSNGIFLTQRFVSVYSADGIFPTPKCQCRRAYELFSIVLRESKPYVMGLPPLGVPHYAEGVPPLRAPV